MLRLRLCAVGLVASGLASGACAEQRGPGRRADPRAGLALAFPLLVNPHFASAQGEAVMPAATSANLSLAQRLTLWNRAYGLGHYVPLFAVSAACALAGAGQHAAVPLRRWLLGASALHVSIIPFTLLCIMPVNMRLAELRIAANKGEAVPAPEVKSLFKK
jgi:hypothetical protein